MKKVAVIGAGLAGLVLAHELAAYAEVTIFEKSRGVGGRMSSRYDGEVFFNHGVPCFIARSNEFKSFLQKPLKLGIVEDWHPKTTTLSKDEKPYRRDWFEPHYRATPRMNSLCRWIAETGALKIVLQNHVSTVARGGSAWDILTLSGECYDSFDFVISTAPPEQTKALLGAISNFDSLLHLPKMICQFVLMMGVRGDLDLGWEMARIHQSPLDWIVAQVNPKGDSSATTTSVVAYSTPSWAEERREEGSESVKDELAQELGSFLPDPLPQVIYQSCHRWLYSQCVVPVGAPYLLDEANGLGACGDWCLGDGVEGAYLSALRLAQRLRELA